MNHISRTTCLSRLAVTIFLAAMHWLATTTPAAAQYSLTATPYQTGSYGFSENINLGWGVAGRGFNFNWNGGNANPQFGPFDPNAQAQLGGGFRSGPFSGGFRLTAGQAADTSMVSQTPSVTVMNGQTGYFSDTTIRPFVTGFVPVVGGANYSIPQPPGGSYYASPLQEKLARLQAGERSSPAVAERTSTPVVNGGGGGKSSAERGTASVLDIKASQAAIEDAKQKEISDLLAQGDALAAEGKNVVAKLIYQQAARRAEGEQHTAIVAKIKRLE